MACSSCGGGRKFGSNIARGTAAPEQATRVIQSSTMKTGYVQPPATASGPAGTQTLRKTV